MISIFYLLIPIFIWSNLYYLLNLNKLTSAKYSKLNAVDFLFFLTKVIYIIWIVYGYFTVNKPFIVTIIAILLIKFISYSLNKKLYKISNILLPILSSLIQISILITLLFRH
jgi:hypothetical protein